MIMLRNDGEEGGQEPSVQSLMLSMERHLSSVGPVSEKRAYEAQQMFYDAMEAPSLKEREVLIHKVLNLDPTNVDALLYCAQAGELQPELEIEVLRKIVALGEKNLGKKTFKECAGAFWGFIETRPYMRARDMLAAALRAEGRLDEAISEWEAMLELNPNDNQALRYNLLACYLALKRLDGAERLFTKFNGGDSRHSAVFSLEPRAGAADRGFCGAKKAMAAARKQNSHVEAYLTGHRKLPKDQSDGLPGEQGRSIVLCRTPSFHGMEASPECIEVVRGNIRSELRCAFCDFAKSSHFLFES